MRTIDKRVTRLDLSKEIEKLGLVKRSPFYWIKHPIGKVEQKGEWGLAFTNAINNIEPENKHVAWQSTELWEYLPNGTKLQKHKNMFEASIIYKGFATTQESNTEQDALAKVLIFLLKNNLIACKKEQK